MKKFKWQDVCGGGDSWTYVAEIGQGCLVLQETYHYEKVSIAMDYVPGVTLKDFGAKEESKEEPKEDKKLKDVICWFASALVDSESTIINASRMHNWIPMHRTLTDHMPVTKGIEGNRLIVELSKYAPETIDGALLERILEERKGNG